MVSNYTISTYQWFASTGLTKYPIFQNPYFQVLVLAALVILVIKLIRLIGFPILEKIVKKTKFKGDNILLKKTKGPFQYLLFVIALYIILSPFVLYQWTYRIIDSFIILIITIIIIRIVDTFIDVWGYTFAKRTESKIDDQLLPLFHKASKVILFIFGILFILYIWNVEIVPFLASLGIAGLAIGLALQDSLKNIFGGISIMIDKTIKVGDKIKLQDGTKGIVHDVHLRATHIRTFDNEIMIVPNAGLSTSIIKNYTEPDKRERINVGFGVAYGTDADKVIKLIKKTVLGVDHVVSDPEPSVDFLEMGDSALKFVARVWVDDYKYAYSTKLECTKKIYNALNKAKIEMPFPQMDVHVKK